jgi:hypothetical protein
VQVELARTQAWIEFNDVALNGVSGDDGVVQEWRDFKSQKKAFETFMKIGMSIVGLLAAFVTTLVGLSAIGLVHLR